MNRILLVAAAALSLFTSCVAAEVCTATGTDTAKCTNVKSCCTNVSCRYTADGNKEWKCDGLSTAACATKATADCT